MKQLQKHRFKALAKKNVSRSESSIKVGDMVLVHRKRFPQYQISKLSPQFFGPYRVIRITHSTVTVRASPKLGGDIIVGFSFLKKFPDTRDDDSSEADTEESDDDAEQKDTRLFPSQAPSRAQEQSPGREPADPVSSFSNAHPPCEHPNHPPRAELNVDSQSMEPCDPEEYTTAEAQSQGYFKVEAILKHRYRNGYQFLTKWENFSVEDSTWEPTKHFVLDSGRINPVFHDYCVTHKLTKALNQAIVLANRQATFNFSEE